MKEDKLNKAKTIIFEAWNNAGIIKHRKLSQKAEVKIKSALKDYTIDEILTAIKNYGIIVNDDAYFFNYRWSLEDFLARGIQKFLDDACYDNFRKNKTKKVYKEKSDDSIKF
ncbi:MAG: hypothetical protein RBR14_06430 [Candidatus Cloacimonas acidaminovorans]|nr:hypothetical protein [Candidatus Cloacimonas acidaminovorans]